MTDHKASNIALDEFTTNVPPGWRPGIKGYSYRDYSDKLKLWWRIKGTDDDAKAAALVVSRLQGSPYKMAMKLRLVRNGVTYEGDDAICLPATAAVIDPISGETVPAEPSGLQVILTRLRNDHRLHDHDEQTEAMDEFFDIRQNNRDLITYLTAFEFAYDEASAKAGLEINLNGRTALLLRRSNLSRKMIDDVLLKADGDMQRYHEITRIL